jgi:uncharacterized protein
MFALGKILETILIVVAVWYGFKYVQRVGETNDRRRRGPASGPMPGGATGAPAPMAGVEDMIRCRECGTWQTGRDAKSCGRRGCPY